MESTEKYKGDFILIERLSEFYAMGENREWNEGEVISLYDISEKYYDEVDHEVSEFFGDTKKYIVFEPKSKEWHIGRIIYFINHPDEIKNIEIDNACINGDILPLPIIIDGHHRFAAAQWLQHKGKMCRIHCLYGGRIDVLEYLQGKRGVLEN